LTRRRSAAARQRLADHLALAERLGGETVTLSGQRIAEEILSYARSNNMTQVVVGAPRHPAWLRLLLRSTADDLVRDAGDIDTHIVSGGKDDAADEPEGRGQDHAEPPG